MVVGKIIIWLIIGALAGTLAGRLVTFSKAGLGTWTNLAIGMVGALVGGGIFWLFDIDLGLGELKVSFEDLISAFLGSMICIVLWWISRKLAARRAGRDHEADELSSEA